MRLALFMIPFLALAAPAAGAPLFALPVDCELGKNCYIQQYMDHDATENFKDFECGPRSYNAHKGTDFAVPTARDAQEGVDILAAAEVTVLGVRDGMSDVWNGEINTDAIKGRECGNGLVLDHGDGWQTQYCHLREGSLNVRKGQIVEAGAKLGQIGMTGRTEFAHLHLSVRKDGKPVDPFAPKGAKCDKPIEKTMWREPLLFQKGGILEIGFAESVPKFADIKMGTAEQELRSISPALVSYFFMFGGKAGDKIDVQFTGPDGFEVTQIYELEKNLARFFRAIGKKRRAEPWPVGIYEARARFTRNGEEIDTQTATFEIKR